MITYHLPRVTLCVPTYQCQTTLSRTLESLQRQTYAALEIVIIDNASKDKTVEIARAFCKNDSRFRIVTSDVNVGAEGNFRRCVELAEGDVIGIFHADDIYDDDMVEQQVRYLIDNPLSAAVFTEAHLIDPNDNRVGDRCIPATLTDAVPSETFNFWSVFRAVLRHHNFLMTPSVLVRAEVYKRLRLFDSGRFGSSADLDVWLQILSTAPVGILGRRLMSYRISSDQGSMTLIRQRTDRADFFKVLDFWMAEPTVAPLLTAQDLQNYNWLDKADRVARAIALAERGARPEVRELLYRLYSPTEFVRAVFQRPRAAVCAVLSTLIQLRLRLGLHPLHGDLTDRLRRLARI